MSSETRPELPIAVPGSIELIPSRAALTRIERFSAQAGHENLGFVSSEAGFLPRHPPPLQLPASHRAWDEAAASLPERWRTASVRRLLASLPTLSAGEGDLPDAYVWRASTILSIFAHAWVRSEIEPAVDLPHAVRRPWVEITQRLGRPEPFLSYADLILCNWRLRDPTRADPMRVENLELLVPTVDNQAERVFYLTQVEIISQCSPLVEAVVQAQEAAVREDRDGLERSLLVILERLQHVTEVSLLKIDPNPIAATHVEPVMWANTVAPFAVPIRQGAPGPSGTAAPIFHLLDGFLGRRGYGTTLGHEARHLRAAMPPHQREFLEAVQAVQIRDSIDRSGDAALRGVFQAVLDAYAGDRGYLGVHRRKTYGYLELAFKVGRQVTIGGFSGGFQDRPWKQVHDELENSRAERYEGLSAHPYYAGLKERSETATGGRVSHVTLDIARTGITYRPGDRVGVLAENTDELVGKTLRALHATGVERVPLTQVWRSALRYRAGLEGAEEIALGDFLRFAKLRPLPRSVGKALQAIAVSPQLERILEARQEDQWELWDVLQLLERDGYDTARLWKSQIFQEEAIARIIPPEPFRMYSASSSADRQLPNELHLTVSQVAFDTRVDGGTPIRRRGTASTYLTSTAPLADSARIPVLPLRPLRFRLPSDPARPIAMFAGGTGISPFRGFLLQRATQPDAGESHLFFGTRSPAELHYSGLLETLLRQRKLQLAVAFSGEEVAVRFDPTADGGRLVFEPAPARRIDALLQEERYARIVWQLMRSQQQGGQEGYLYICGQAEFAQSVMSALVATAARFSSGSEGEQEQAGRSALRKLVAEGRLMLDVFTTLRPAGAPGVLGSAVYNASDVAAHNDAEHGYWMVVSGAVYDMTEFMHLHPGGVRIVLENVGRDATREYQAVQHHEHSEVDAVLSMYRIGSIRRLDLRGAWGIAVQPSGMAYMSLQDLFRTWVRYLYLVVEMQNAFRNDLGYLDGPATRGDDTDRFSPLKAMLVTNTHRRFLAGYFDGALGKDITDLWAMTVSLCAPQEDVAWMGRELAAVRAGEEASAVLSFSQQLGGLYQELRDAEGTEALHLENRARSLSSRVTDLDDRFLQDLKHVVREGVMVFEELEAQTIRSGGQRLVESLRRVPTIAGRYLASLADQARAVDPPLGSSTVQ